MIRPLYLLLSCLLALACVHAEGPRLPDSLLMLHVSPLAAMANIHGVALITITVGGLAGAGVSCTPMRLEIDGLTRSAREPDCAPEDVDRDGGAVSWRVWLGQGTHTITVDAQEPGRRTFHSWRSVEVR